MLSVKLKRKYRRFEKKHSLQRHGSDGYQGAILLERVERKAVPDSLHRRLLKEGSGERMGKQAFNRRVVDGTTQKEWIAENGKPKKVMHGGGKQFVSRGFQKFLRDNDIKDNKQTPPGYPQAQGKVEAYNKIVI